MKVKRACWNCKSYFKCEASGKSKKGNYYCKEHKFNLRLRLNNN